MILDVDAMTAAELRVALRISVPTYWRYRQRGMLDRFRLVPTINPRAPYSRAAVRRYLDRDPPVPLVRAVSQ